MRVQPKGEAIPFIVFAVVSLVGFFLSFGIQGRSLEADGWDSHDNESTKSDEDE